MRNACVAGAGNLNKAVWLLLRKRGVLGAFAAWGLGIAGHLNKNAPSAGITRQ